MELKNMEQNKIQPSDEKVYPIKVCHLNIRGILAKKKHKIIALERMLHNNNIDVCCLNEVHITKNDINRLKFRNHKVASSYLREKKEGGTLILVKKNIVYKSSNVTHHAELNVIEMSAVEIGSLFILSVYRPPNGDKEKFQTGLTNVFLEALNNSFQVIVASDLNLDPIKQEKLIDHIIKKSQEYPNCKHVLIRKVFPGNIVTRYEIKQGKEISSSLDNVIVGDCIIVNSEVKDLIMTDHRTLIITVYCRKIGYKFKVYFETLNSKETHISSISTKISNDQENQEENPKKKSLLENETKFLDILGKYATYVIQKRIVHELEGRVKKRKLKAAYNDYIIALKEYNNYLENSENKSIYNLEDSNGKCTQLGASSSIANKLLQRKVVRKLILFFNLFIFYM